MASGEPSPCLMKQIQLAVCQLCGRDMGHGSHEPKVNYQKQVDEPSPPYTQIIPDYRYDEIEAYNKKRKGIKDDAGKKAPLQVCVQFPTGTVQQPLTVAPPTSVAEQQQQQQQQSKQAAAKEATATSDNSATVKSACLPAGGGGGGNCPVPVKMMLCLPCPPPDVPMAAQQAPRRKPKDYTYRCESRELRGGNLYQCCQCVKRNGLQHDCPRTPCQGRAACLVKPWPDCWPSGGCHGIDYTRENGLKRYDPCAEQRFDKKECRPPSFQPKPDCGGNMMIVVCPPPQSC